MALGCLYGSCLPTAGLFAFERTTLSGHVLFKVYVWRLYEHWCTDNCHLLTMLGAWAQECLYIMIMSIQALARGLSRNLPVSSSSPLSFLLCASTILRSEERRVGKAC